MTKDKTAWLSAVVLAAGESKRMGKPKQLMPFGRITIVERSIDNFLHSKVDEVIVVLGHKAEGVMGEIANRPVKIAINHAYRQGISTSIRTGLNLIDERAQGIMLALADQPRIDSKTINRLIEEFYNHDKGIAIPTYQGKRGHPVIFSIKYKEQLLRLKGDIGGRQIIDHHHDDVLEVPVNCEGVCIDIDTVASYHLEISKLR